MDLYLMQHGEAMTEEQDPERPLTESGRESVRRVAERARAAGVEGLLCVHSGKLRAEQSAQLLATGLGGGSTVESRSGLSPNDAVGPVAQWVRDQWVREQRLHGRATEPTPALVGHLPFLGRLVSLLVAGDEEAQVVRFTMAGLLKLESSPEGDRFSVGWYLTPELA